MTGLRSEAVVQLRGVLRTGAVAAVLALLGLLIWHATTRRGGGALVAAVQHKQMPVAPPFDMPVIWHEDESWPKDLTAVADSDHLTLAQLRGRTVVVNFWASWCPPCKRETPLLVQSAWHRDVVAECRIAFLAEIEARHIARAQIDIFEVPGSFEIPLLAFILCSRLARGDGV